ncbi:MAG: aminopeptidase, partial [Eubacterium sp.]|nr:aminopeptidase [Eubacterium sp.]
MQERFELSRDRIKEITTEKIDGQYGEYLSVLSRTLYESTKVLEQVCGDGIENVDLPQLKAWNTFFYGELREENYEKCFGNPDFTHDQFGEEEGKLLCYLYARLRNAIQAAYEGDIECLTIYLELYLMVYNILQNEEEKSRWLKETIYYFVHDYSEFFAEKSVKRAIDPSRDRYVRIVNESDLKDEKYLYYYGQNITDNEINTARFLANLDEEKINTIAKAYTNGYKVGFEVAGIDLSKKETVNIRYNIGFERIVKTSIEMFADMGLKPVIYMVGNTRNFGVSTTQANPQYEYDHRFDDSIYLNQAIVNEDLKHIKNAFEDNKDLAAVHAGPAVIEVFGEKIFKPISKNTSPRYDEEQEKLFIQKSQKNAIIQSEYIKPDERSFTIIAFPIPEIGGDFEKIFDETIRINTLDVDMYREVHQKLIDCLDKGDSVRVTGRGANKTDITVKLHKLDKPDEQTNFENCLADVNIPVGEVFTSPVLKGTNGTLHVTKVYLNKLRYDDLKIEFKDGMIDDYTCGNFENEEESKKYIKENIMKNRET